MQVYGNNEQQHKIWKLVKQAQCNTEIAQKGTTLAWWRKLYQKQNTRSTQHKNLYEWKKINSDKAKKRENGETGARTARST